MKQKLFFSALILIANLNILPKPEVLEKSFKNGTKEIKLQNIGKIKEILKGSHNGSEYIKIDVENPQAQNTLDQIDEKLLKVSQDKIPVFKAASVSKNKLKPENETIILQLNPEMLSHFTNKLPSNEEVIIGVRNKKSSTKKLEANLRKIKL